MPLPQAPTTTFDLAADEAATERLDASLRAAVLLLGGVLLPVVGLTLYTLAPPWGLA